MSDSVHGPTTTTTSRQVMAQLEPPMSRRRKEMEAGGFGFFDSQPPPRPPMKTTTKAEMAAERKPMTTTTTTQAALRRPVDNRLLAGYLAHEFLSRGTLCGQRWNPAAAAARAILSRAPDGALQQRPQPVKEASQKQKAAPAGKPMGYAEVAGILMGESAAHIPGVVNPTQLGQWLQM